MAAKRVVNDDKKIQNFLKNAKGDDEVQLPVFSVADDGSWEYKGVTYVRTLEDYKKYKQIYGELMGFIYENFNSSIAKLYKKTLNNLIFVDEKDYDKEFIDSLGAKNGKSISLGKLLARRENEDVDSYEDNAEENLSSIINIVRYVQGAEKRYVPSEIIKFIKDEGIKDKNNIYLFPELSEKGIVSKIGKDSGNIEMNFVMIDEEQALKIKNYMISQFGKKNEDAIEYYFEKCKNLTELSDSYENYKDSLEDVAHASVWFFGGLDPTGYLKKERVHSEALAEEQNEIFADANDGLVGEDVGFVADDDNFVPQNGSAWGLENQVAGLESSVNVSSIQMNSPYCSSTALDGADIVINIKPTNGATFKVVLDGEKLKVSEATKKAGEAELDK